MCCVCAALCVWLLRGAGCLLVACGCLLVRACVRVLVGAGGAGGGALSGSGAVRPVGGSVVAGWLPAAVCLLWFLPVFWLVGLRGGWWVGGGWLVWAGWL